MTGLRTRMRREGGFTLPDVLVGMTLSMIVTSLVVAGAMAIHRTQRYSGTDTDNLASLRVALGRFEREAREARRIYDDSSPTRIHLWLDFDRDYQQESAEQVYWEIVDVDGAGALSAAELTRTTTEAIGSGTPPAVVARDLVYQDTFFYNGDSPETSTLVTLALRAEQPGTHSPGRTVRTAVRMRNASTDAATADDQESDVDGQDELDG